MVQEEASSPILPQEAQVLELWLDAGSGGSQLPVDGRHVFLHQAANLQVFLQDILPAWPTPTGPPSQRASARGMEASKAEDRFSSNSKLHPAASAQVHRNDFRRVTRKASLALRLLTGP